ncbi:MAG TPA: hypothetical protein ENH01_04610 [Nitrospirae bacterium]|nr:hypothetical protein [Nitrospirota bacterium]
MVNLVSLLNYSERTIKRRLKHWKAYTSYNYNSSFYVLPDIPEFDQYGIWKYRKIFFSKFGNLNKTLKGIIDQSVAGLTASEISDILGLSAYTFLSHFKNDPNLQRHQHNGRYIYFSKKPNIFEIQKTGRDEIRQSIAESDLPSDSDSVIILAELIKHPKDTIEQLTRRTRRKGIKVSIEKVRNLLVYLDLLKKTPDSQLFEH